MGGSDTSSQQQTNSQQVTQLPPWINQAAQQNYAYAQNVANRPLQQYQGQMVADVGPQMQQAWNLAANSGNVGQDQYNAAQGGYLGVLGSQPQQVTAGQLSKTNLSPYMNPYTQSVINATLPIMQQQLGINQIGNQAQAAGAGAFGGSRQGIQQGVTQAQGAQGMGQMAAQLNQANFQQAQGAAEQDIQGRMQAALANQAAQQNQMGLNIQAAGGLGALGNAAQMNQLRNFTELMTAGTAEQQQAQNQINAQIAKFQQAWGYPYQQLGTLQSALGMTPYGTATQGQQNTTSQTQTSADPFSVLAGGLGFAGDLLKLSDRKMKTDIQKIGTHPTGIPMYAYRYKGDPKSYPKVAGPMAEDVMKVAPHAVRPIGGGKMGVNLSALDALSPNATPPTATPGAGVRMPGMGRGLGRMGLGGGIPATPMPGQAGSGLPVGGGLNVPPSMPPGRRIRGPQIRGALGG